MRSGGVILFDTADADLAFGGRVTGNGEQLQLIARNLDIPPLEPVPDHHVLTRSFYLLESFPGRYLEGDVWLETSIAPPIGNLGLGGQADTPPLERRLNDNVSPVVIGGQDWAAAWAIDARGQYMRPVGFGETGQRQRELAYRFGVNLVMYVLTGNYKADQVHVPALLERLEEER
jgi:hypothetical protein